MTLISIQNKTNLILIFVILTLAFMAIPVIAAQDLDTRDVEISFAVTEQLMDDPGVSGFNVDAETENGIVTLTGTVNNILAQKRSERLAATVKGVRGVINRIEILDSGRADDEIEEDIVAALAEDPATESWEIDVSVVDETAILTGEVDSWQESRLASRVAQGVRGVQGVTNSLRTNYAEIRPDNEIKKEIVQVLRWDALVDDELIDVHVDSGEVSLTGTVGSLAEKNLAYTDSWVNGVREVDNQLEVESWARDSRFRETKYVEKSDSEIRRAVLASFIYDPRVSPFDIAADVNEGIVRLSGTVDNIKAKRAAARDARNTVGVWRVDNQISVRSDAPSDDTIENRVASALLRDPYVSRFEIDVTSENQIVYLRGSVDTQFEKARADNVAGSVEGVVMVKNSLAVDNNLEPLTYDRYANDNWSIKDYDWYMNPDIYSTIKSDWEIRDEITEELYWSPFVDEEDINVSVVNGVATLTGTVDTWSERIAAGKNAWDAGAIAVDNDLNVVYGPTYYQ